MEQGLIRLEAGGGVKGSTGCAEALHRGKIVAFRHYPCLALCCHLRNQEKLCWLQQKAALASLKLPGLMLGENWQSTRSDFWEVLKVTLASTEIRGSCRCLQHWV